MKRTTTLILAAGIAATAALAAPSAAHAEETTCRGSLGAVTVDNLRVPDNASCRLTGTRVKGTIKIESNARLGADRVNVIGNVQGENFAAVKLTNSTVGGSVQLVQGGSATVTGNSIEGTLLFDDNSAWNVATNNTIDSDPAGLPEHRRRTAAQQPDRRQPAVQGEPPRSHRGREHRAGQQGRPVRQALTRS